MDWTILYYAFIALLIHAAIITTAINWANVRALDKMKPR